MLFCTRYMIRSFEMGLYFRDGEFRGPESHLPHPSARDRLELGAVGRVPGEKGLADRVLNLI